MDRRVAAVAMCIVLAATASACTGSSAAPSRRERIERSSKQGAALKRITAINGAVEQWRGASSVAAALEGAERARNLVVGPTGPDYGDTDDDGTVAGATKTGLLPGLDEAPGLASPLAGMCAARDVLGGSWADPASRWNDVSERVATWSESNNRFPELPSHPQRIVGWATLALASDDLDQIHEFAGHAALHVHVAEAALKC